MLLWLFVQAALAGPCADRCEEAFSSCAAVSAAGCGVAGAATEKAAGKALGSVPMGGLLAKGRGNNAKAMCEEKRAPCNETKAQCLTACGEGAPAPGPVASLQASPGAAAPTPLLVFGTAPGASIWIDGQRAGVLPSSPSD